MVLRGTVTVSPTVAHHCSAANVNRKLAALTSFCGFYARYGCRVDGLLVSIAPAGRQGWSPTACKPFLHHRLTETNDFDHEP
jgi:integrase/recombinase XerD